MYGKPFRDSPSKRVFAGRIRDARVYKRQLGAAEVAQLFASGPNISFKPPAAGWTYVYTGDLAAALVALTTRDPSH